MTGRWRGIRRSRWDVYEFSGTQIAQLFARFFLNRFFVCLQSLNLLRIEFVLLLFQHDPPLQRLVFHALLFVNDHAIRAKHHMHE